MAGEGALDKPQKFSIRDLVYLAGIVISGIVFYYRGQAETDEKINAIKTEQAVMKAEQSETLKKVETLTQKLEKNNEVINKLALAISAKFGVPIEQ